MFRHAWVVPALGCALLSTPAVAQEDSSASPLEEIVVSAQRRDENLFEVPLAVTALSGEFLERQQVFTAEQLSLYTPSLHIFAEAVNTEFYTIRGVGRANEDLGSDSGVAMFIDDVYVARQGAANLVLFDVERAEILRGPQGTLWGKNATGGAINMITRRPTDEGGGYAGVDVGDYGTLNLRGALNGSLSDAVNGRFAFVSRQRDGLYTNLTTGQEGNNIDTQAVRGSLTFAPSDRTEFFFSADWAQSEQLGVLKSVIADVPGTPYILKDFFTVTFPLQEEDLRTSRSGVHGEQGVEQYGLNMTINHALGDSLDLVSITGYRTEESYHAEDNDRAAERSGDLWSTQDSSSFSQELRLMSAGESALTWTAGLYWFYEEGDRDQSRYSDFFGPGGLVGPGSPEIQDSTTTFQQMIETNSFAVFGQADYAFNEQWSVTVGGRYTEESKDYDINAFAIPNQPGGSDYSLFIPDGAFTASDKETWSQFTPMVSVQFAPTDNVNTYLRYAEGFKSGGYNGSPDNAAGVVPFDPETAETIELGLKGQFFDRTMSANIAYFMTDFEDMQLQGFDPVTGAPITNNAAASEISGLEVELNGIIGDGFRYTIGASWLDHQFTSYAIEVFDPTIENGPPFRLVDKSGDRIGLIPEYNYHIGLGYEWNLGGGSSLTLTADYSAMDETITVFNTLWSNSYEVLDARLAWDSNKNWNAALWVRNLGDEDYYRGGGPVPDINDTISRVGLLADPRIVGVSIGYNFGN